MSRWSELLDRAGLATTQSWGFALLGVIAALWAVREGINYLTKGECEVVSPVMQCGSAALITGGIGYLGPELAALSHDMASEVLSERAFLEAMGQHASVGALGALGGGVFSWLNPVKWVELGIVAAMLLTVVVKFVLIDFLWHVLFSFCLIVGPLSLSLAVVPGGKGVASWVRSMVEIALWPVVYAVLMRLMSEILESWQWSFTLEAYAEHMSLGDLFYPLTRLSLALVITTLTLFTPYLAHTIVRTEAAGAIGGMAMALYVGVAAQATRAVSGVAPSLVAGPAAGAGAAAGAAAGAVTELGKSNGGQGGDPSSAQRLEGEP